MMENSSEDDLERAAVAIISHKSVSEITKVFISNTVQMLASAFSLSQEQLTKVQRRIEERFSFTMETGDILQENFEPWLDNRKGSIEWYYWKRYKEYLLNKKQMGPKVVSSLDEVTERILSLSENPEKQGVWERKGMVVGQVQSGKTANYVGLISKAADAGYKVFIVIAGITNSLRRQTQMRIEQGFTGYSTGNDNFLPTGVGIADNSSLAKRPITFTTIYKDFNKNLASQVGANIKSFANPVIFVIKKNTNTLRNLIDWLKQNVQSRDSIAGIDDVPMMLIDDEADNASINTSKDPEKATKINALIRELLGIFKEKCYIGYTATPFANIFIDNTAAKELGEDLFPKDFIYCLDAPSNYFGANKIFLDMPERIVKIISDHQKNLSDGSISGAIPIVHKKDLEIKELPQSLCDAINLFILVRAIRILRGNGDSHNSMLVNVSRYNDVQGRIKEKIIEYLSELQNSIRYSYKMPNAETYPVISNLKRLFDIEYSQTCGIKWLDIQDKLHEAAASIKVYNINQRSQDALDYEKYSQGLNIIAVGGLALSRGLTLEGLSISYLIRNTMMYDTLMQMGRWFGYRDGYEDLCRVYMPQESFNWYEFITDATNELISDFKYMTSLSATPSSFGLRVRKSPFKLLITAKNKMLHGMPIREKVDLSGRYVETKRVYISKEELEHNQKLFYDLIAKLQSLTPQDSNCSGYLWSDVPSEFVEDFIRDFRNHETSTDTQTSLMHRFIKNMTTRDNITCWDITLISLKRANVEEFQLPIEGMPLTIKKPLRTIGKFTSDRKGIEVSSRRRMASEGVEQIGLSEEQIMRAESGFKPNGKNNIDQAYRRVRVKPLLILFIADFSDEKNIYNNIPVYGISFPYINRNYEYEGEEYMVNLQWIQENYGVLTDNDEDEDADEEDK